MLLEVIVGWDVAVYWLLDNVLIVRYSRILEVGWRSWYGARCQAEKGEKRENMGWRHSASQPCQSCDHLGVGIYTEYKQKRRSRTGATQRSAPKEERKKTTKCCQGWRREAVEAVEADEVAMMLLSFYPRHLRINGDIPGVDLGYVVCLWLPVSV